MLLPLLVALISFSSAYRPIEDICHHHTGRRVFVDLGESGTLTAQNVTESTKAWRSLNRTKNIGLPKTNDTNTISHRQCSIEFVTCPSCLISVVFRSIDLSYQCGGSNLVMDNLCRCDYIWISEPLYEDLTGQQFCGIHKNMSGDMKYETRTRTLRVTLLYSEDHANAFTLDFYVKKNQEIYSGGPNDVQNSSGTFSSPFFPSKYPRDLAMEFFLTCAELKDCRVRIIFTDFQIADASFIEFFDGESQTLEAVTGSSFRPPVMVSNGSSILLRFYANGATNVGFRATYSFITGPFIDSAVKPITDCGGFVEDFGGAITMMNMVMDGAQSYDCIWLVRPLENFFHLKSHLYLKVATFSDYAGSTELQIRQGLTTEAPILDTLRFPVSQFSPQRMREYVVPVTSGFYIRLMGTFNNASRLAIVYASFSYNKCFPYTEYLCANHRCIPGKLTCDHFDHCGDGSDEPDTCFREYESNQDDRIWNSQTPNYFFPKADRYTDLRTATLVFLMSSFGLIVVLSTLIILLHRMNSRARQQRELQSHLQTISDLLADNVRVEEFEPDEPPVYEAPPTYDEIIKSTPSSSSSGRRRKIRGGRSTSGRSRSSPPQRRRVPEDGLPVPILEVSSPVGRTSLRNLNAQSSRSRRVSMISVISSGAVSQQSAVPNSPPPPYSPTNNQQFIFVDSSTHAASNRHSATSSSSNILDLDNTPQQSTWCVTAVSPSHIADFDWSSRRIHQRSLSWGDYSDNYQISERRLTQSNPLTPINSAAQPCIEDAISPEPSLTDADICYSSLDSSAQGESIDWEEFDKQFPRSVARSSTKVAKIRKKYDGASTGLETSCDCVEGGKTVKMLEESFSFPSVRRQINDVWGNGSKSETRIDIGD